MMQTKLIGPFREIVTLRDLKLKGSLDDSDLSVIKRGGVLIRNGLILEVGEFSSLTDKAEEVEEIGESMVLIPGLVDCHTHTVWGGSRSRDYALRMRGETYEKILEEGGGIFDSVDKTRTTGRGQLLDAFLSRIQRHQKSGVTTIEVKSGYGLDLENEVKMLEVVNEARGLVSADLISTCLAAHVCPKEYSDKSEYLNFVVNDLLPLLSQKKLASRVDAFIEPSAFPVKEAEVYLRSAQKLGFELTVHADQFTTGGSRLAVELGARSADHLESSGEREIGMLAQSDTVAVALPGASLGLGMQFTPARMLLDAGASVAIATDWNPGSAPMGDLLTQAALLGIYEKLSTAEVLAGITFRAAHALGLQDRGKISSDMRADFTAFPTKDYRDILYHQGQLTPSMVWKSGQRI